VASSSVFWGQWTIRRRLNTLTKLTMREIEVKKMSKLGTIARVAVGIVVIGTLWPIGLFGDD